RMELVLDVESRAAGSRPEGVTPLHHEARDDTVKLRAVEVSALRLHPGHGIDELFRPFGQSDEVLDGDRRFLVVETADDAPLAGVQDGFHDAFLQSGGVRRRVTSP